MAIAEIKWKLVKDTYFFDTTTCYLSENGNHLFYVGKEKRIEILINDLNELVRKGCALWLELGEHEFGLDKLSKCPTQTWYGIHQMLYSLEPWGVMKESKESARKSIKESKGVDKLDVLSLCYYCTEDVDVEIYSYYNANDEVKLLDSFKRKNYLGSAYKYNQIESFEIDGNTMIIYLEQDTEIM